MPGTAVLFLSLTALALPQMATGASKLHNTVQAWRNYREECLRTIQQEPTLYGPHCNRTFDLYACWPDGEPNSTVRVPCPWYLPWYHIVREHFAYRRCDANGYWVLGNNSQAWRNLSDCQFDPTQLQAQVESGQILNRFRVMYSVGYSVSVAALTIACIILRALRRLRCTRNYIHLNLFASFIVRGVSILTRDQLLWGSYDQGTEYQGTLRVLQSDQAVLACRIAQVITQYCVLANYCWLLVEGLYLHSILVLLLYSKTTHYHRYNVLGWGTPVIFVTPWVIVKYLYENTQCWIQNENMGYWWIIRLPILLAIVVNGTIFVQIVWILVSKTQGMGRTHCSLRLTRSTLTLAPLLGIHELVFVFLTDEQATGTLRLVKLFFESFFSSLQGLLVATLYCFLNADVQEEVKRAWGRWTASPGSWRWRRARETSAPREPGERGRAAIGPRGAEERGLSLLAGRAASPESGAH